MAIQHRKYVPFFDEEDLFWFFGSAAVGPGLAVCTLTSILDRAQQESGYSILPYTTRTTLTDHILRYRQHLTSKLAGAWKGSDRYDQTIAVTADSLVLQPMEAIWEVLARAVSSGQWVPVNVVSQWDAGALDDPALTLRAGEAKLIRYATGWVGQYDTLRLLGMPVPSPTASPATDLAPNQILGPLFCTCLALEGARFLATAAKDRMAAAGLVIDLRRAELGILSQAATLPFRETSRERDP